MPAFVVDWMKNTSATGHIRYGTAPNRRVQDGLKLPLLCRACEGSLSTWEKSFAEQIFVPHHALEMPGNAQPARTYRYGTWLAKFAASVSWRTLVFILRERGFPDQFPESLKPNARAAEEAWRRFLLSERPHPGVFEQHMICLDSIASSTISMPRNMNRYIRRAPEIDLVFTPRSAFVYSKLCRLVVLGFIEMPQRTKWRGTKIHISGGTIPEQDVFIDRCVVDYMMDRARRLEELRASLSPRQQEAIEAALRRDPDRALNSDTFRALLDDLALSGGVPGLPSED